MPPYARPSFERVREAMGRWSIPRLERYLCRHGRRFRLPLLRQVLRYRNISAGVYVATLVEVAHQKFMAGNTLSTMEVLQRMRLLPLWWGQQRPEVQVNLIAQNMVFD